MRHYVGTGYLTPGGTVKRDNIFRVDVRRGEEGNETVTVREDRSLTARLGRRLLAPLDDIGIFIREGHRNQEGLQTYGAQVDVWSRNNLGHTRLTIEAGVPVVGTQADSVMSVEAVPILQTGITRSKPWGSPQVTTITTQDGLEPVRRLNAPYSRELDANTVIGMIAIEPALVQTGNPRQGITFALPPR